MLTHLASTIDSLFQITLHPSDWIWRYCMVGASISVAWPKDDLEKKYRPWLEASVGRQGWDWSWELRESDVGNQSITICFRRGKTQWATLAALMWS